MIIVINAGTATSNRFQLISAKFAAINTPTTTSAGVVTALVTTAINGLKNSANKKQNPVTILAKPVLAPTATPEVDSMYDVVVVVPKIAPTIVASESENKALPALGNLLSFIMPACVATATKVPAVSKKSINKKVKMTIKNCIVNNCPGSLNASNAAPNVGLILGI